MLRQGAPPPSALQRERVLFVARRGVCRDWEERNDWVFRGKERDQREVWDLIRFHLFLRASILRTFCNYSVGYILISWTSFL